MHDVENCVCETSPPVWYFLESESLETQQGNRGSYKINCQNFNKLPPCIINAGYSRASLRILVPYDTMWLNMKPLPQPAAPSHSSNSPVSLCSKNKNCPSFYCSHRGFIGYEKWFCTHTVLQLTGESGDEGEDTGGGKMRESLSDFPLTASFMSST